MKKIIIAATLVCSFVFAANAQNKISFEHLDLGVSAGTTGLGIDLAVPLNQHLRVRAGFSFIPEFDKKINFGIEGRKKDENGNWVPTKFDKMAEKFSQLTSLKIDDNVDMLGTPDFYNGNLLVDYYPIKKSAFRITAGFYFGGSKVAHARNTIEDMSSLLGVTMYNQFYSKIENGEPVIGDDIYLTPELEEKFMQYGRMGIYIGDWADNGEPYMMEPADDSTVKVDIFANSFKPYLGVGYGGQLTKRNEGIRLEFDAGMLFWGGTPEIIAHDGTDLAKDVVNVSGKVGRYVRFIKGLKVYPVLNLRLSFRLF